MNTPYPSNSAPARLFLAVFMLIFGGIGVTVLIFLWGTPRNSFGAPPLFFRVFGSFIAIGFIAFSGFGVLGVLTGRPKVPGPWRGPAAGPPPPPPPGSFSCPSCGAGLAADAEISPSGDVKCTYCNNWLNVRGDA